MDTATVLTYTGNPAARYPRVYYTGLAGVDTLTVTTKFSSSLYSETSTVPTNSDTYTVAGADPVFSIGSLSNYINVIYETSTLRINQAFQNRLTINLYGAIAGQPFTIQTSGGSGDGVVTETVTAGSTATGCAVSNHILSNTSPSNQQLTCNIIVTKAASQNYFAESLTATVYFMLFVNNQPSGEVGNGSTIALNGKTALTVEAGSAPAITGFDFNTIEAGELLRIFGSEFNAANVSVKFWRNVSATPFAIAPDGTYLDVFVPLAARSGPVYVITSLGTAISPTQLAVTQVIINLG